MGGGRVRESLRDGREGERELERWGGGRERVREMGRRERES